MLQKLLDKASLLDVTRMIARNSQEGRRTATQIAEVKCVRIKFTL